MRCRKIQRMIMEGAENGTSAEELSGMKKHLRDCPECSRLDHDYERILAVFRSGPDLAPPEDLASRTRALCLARIEAQGAMPGFSAEGTRSKDIPGFIYGILVALFGLTMIYITPLFKDLNLDARLTFRTVIALIVLVQNFVALFLAPVVLLRRGAHLRMGNVGPDGNQDSARGL